MIDERLGANKMRAQEHRMAPPDAFFHPDYDRRPWNLTRSADPGMAGALAGLSFDLPPVGTFTPP